MTPEENKRRKPTKAQYCIEAMKIYMAHVKLKPCDKCGWPVRDGWSCTYCGWSGE